MNNTLWEMYMKVIHGAGIGDADAWAKLDLTMPQLKVLMILASRKEATVGTLAEIMEASLSNMTGILDRLENQGLIERIPSISDRRSVNIRLTDEARKIFQQLNQSGFEKFSRIINSLTPDARNKVETGLRILANSLYNDTI